MALAATVPTQPATRLGSPQVDAQIDIILRHSNPLSFAQGLLIHGQIERMDPALVRAAAAVWTGCYRRRAWQVGE